MHILVINWQDKSHPQAGGAEVHLHEIFGRIASKGHTVTLVSCGFKGAPRREIADGINIIRIGRRPWFNFAVPVWWLMNGMRKSYDIVVDDINKLPFFSPLFVRKPILVLLHHFFGKSIFSEIGWLPGSYVRLFERMIPVVYAKNMLCVVSESTRKECLEQGFASEQIHVIHNAINVSLFPMKVTEKAPQPTIVYFGRLKRYKSIDHLLRALVLVQRRFPTVRLQILGTGDDQRRLERLAGELGIQNSVDFFGFVPDKQKSTLLSAAHLAVNPSVKEGWGITNIEANACGTPAISADSPGLRDSVRDGESGRLYPYGDIEKLSEIIVELLTNVDEYQRLCTGAVAWASRFTWEASAASMLELCDRVIHEYHAN